GHIKKVLGFLELARDEGGKILTGGAKVKLEGRCEQGYFVSPTVITGLNHLCRTNQEEIFGPVVTIIPFDSEDEVIGYIFDSEDEVIGYANSTAYGLSATIWTEN